MAKNSKVFDIIVLAGMVVNIILAVFLILYYFDFLSYRIHQMKMGFGEQNSQWNSGKTTASTYIQNSLIW